MTARWSVAVLCVLALTACSESTSKTRGQRGTKALQTISDVQVPVVKLLRTAPGPDAGGYLFVAEKKGGSTGGPMIVDERGRVRWYRQVDPPLETADFRVQRYRGRPVLTWWVGRLSKAGIGRGVYEIYDTSYRRIAEVRAGHGLEGDLHEFQLTPRGTAYITAYRALPADLRSVGGPRRGFVYDSVVQEIDVATGHVAFEWHSLDHVSIAESVHANREPARHASKKRPFDYFHVNSVSEGPNGSILISARNTCAVYLLARDGRIRWRLGGKRSDFRPAAAVRFGFQHDARLHPGDLLSLFDNGGIPRVEPYSRPLVLRLDVKHRRAHIVRTFSPPHKLASPYEGNLQLLPGGGAIVGWGGVRRVSEFARDGSLRLQLQLPYGDTYRAYRGEWRGRPPGPPATVVRGDAVHVSWNGSTSVERWDVLAGNDGDHLRVVASARWSGLETAIPVETSAELLAVRALDARGNSLGTWQITRR